MKKTYIMQMALAGLFLLGAAACTPDAEDYDRAGLVDGVGAYFSPEAVTSYKLEGATGSISIDVLRSNTEEAAEAALTATFSEGGESVFTVPSAVSFAAGESTSTLTINYDNLVQGTTYKIALDFAEGTPYSNSSLALTVSWPNEIVYTWEVVSTNAILTESVFSFISMNNIQTTGITVEKANEGEVYRFRSPFNNAYFYDAFGGDVFEDDSDLPYIIVDGETYKDANGKPMFYIAPTALGFTFSVEGSSVYIDTDDKETPTFGSVAGNLSTDAGLIEPGNATYPLGSYDEQKKILDLGCVYLDVANYGILTTKAGSTTLALDPSMLEPDYDRDYTWIAVPEATGFFTSELTGESWMQAVEQSEEDETFYRLPNLYSPAEKAHVYFNVDMETGVVTIPEGQNTGLTTFGNPVYLKGTANASSFDTETGTLTLGFTFYLADEEGNAIADLQETTETFLWGQSEFDQLQQGTDIADYVGDWVVSLTVTDGSEGGQVLASITQKDATTLAVQGLTAGMMGDYDDTMLLSYDEETGWVRFDLQQVASFSGYNVLVAAYNSETREFGEEGLIGGLDKAGNLKFLNDESNQGKYDAMVYLATDGQSMMYLTGYWNNLLWAPYSTSAQQASFNRTSALSFQKVEQGFVPRRTYKTELNIQPKPVTKKTSATKRVSFDSSLMGGANTTFSMTR